MSHRLLCWALSTSGRSKLPVAGEGRQASGETPASPTQRLHHNSIPTAWGDHPGPPSQVDTGPSPGSPGPGSPPQGLDATPTLGPRLVSLSGGICSPCFCHPQLFSASGPFHFLLCLFLPRWFPNIPCSPLPAPAFSPYPSVPMAQPRSHGGRRQGVGSSGFESSPCPFLAR